MAGTRVLLVDDDQVVRMSLTSVLEHSGFTVTSAANVPDALKLIIGPETYDVLLSDYLVFTKAALDAFVERGSE